MDGQGQRIGHRIGASATIRTVVDVEDGQVRLPVSTQRVRFVELAAGALSALAGGDLPTATMLAGVPLTEYFVTDDARWLWWFRLEQIATVPDHATWAMRYAVVGADGAVVGHSGFHGPPDEAGMVEIAYSVDPDFRRQGYARAMLIELLRRAAVDPAVTTVRATIRPDNVASLATISGFGFVEVGAQWDERDGRELIFERPANG